MFDFNIILFLLWGFHILRRFFYYFYLWQVKSYRLDRFLEEAKRNKKSIFPTTSLIFIIIIIFVILNKEIYSLYVTGLILFLLSFYSLVLFLKRKWHFPFFTKKIILNFILTILFWFYLVLYFKKEIILFIPIFEIFLPFFILLSFVLFEIPIFFIKKYLIRKAKRKRERFPHLLVIGITGSYGKTSTKDFLYHLLSCKYGKERVLKTQKNINIDIGIAKVILHSLKPDHKFFICEIGAYRKGEVKDVCGFIKPRIAIVTGVNEQHLALFGSMENLLSAEGGEELIDSLPQDGIAFFNAKNKYCVDLYKKVKTKKYLYGEKAENFAKENLSGAIAVAKELGMKDEEIKEAIKEIENKLPGIEMKKGKNDFIILDSSYSSNPTGVIAHLDYLKNFNGKKVIIMPCLIELGYAAKEIHKNIGKKISQVCDLGIITTESNFKEIKEEAGNKVVLIKDPQDIFKKVMSFCQSKDVILLEGRVPNLLIKLLV